MKEGPSRVDDKPEGDAESAGGGVVDGVVAVRGVASSDRDILAVARTLA